MKWAKRISLVLLLVIFLTVVITYFCLNSIIRSAIESQASASMNVPTTLASADLSIFGGKVALTDLQVGSPPNFSSPHMFTLAGVSVAVHYGQLTSNPVHISSIVIDNPALVVEQSNLKLNIQALTSQPAATPHTSSGQPTQPVKLIIDQLQVNNAKVTFLPGLPGLSNQIDVAIPSLTMNNIGNADGAQNGVAIRDVIVLITSALAQQGAKASNLPLNVNDLVDSKLGNSVTHALDKNLSPNTSGQLQQGIKSLFGSDSQKKKQ